jgi:hypothetical protein
VRVVYRPHPEASADVAAAVEARQWSHVTVDAVDAAMSADDADLQPGAHADALAGYAALLQAAAAVVTPLSPLVIDALVAGTPTLALAYGPSPGDSATAGAEWPQHLEPLRTSSALLICEDRARLVRDCVRLLKPRWDAKTDRARAALLEQVIVVGPGSYADRLADFCHARVESVARKMRAQRTGVKRTTISHAYGAHLIAHEYTGVAGDAVVPGYWMHGWLPSYHNVHPALIALHKKEGQGDGYDYAAQIAEEKAHVPQWVAREDQAAYLRTQGYRHVRAIGLPVVYLPPTDVARVPGSLLVMPPHSHRSHGPDDPLADAYADAIESVRGRFTEVWVGVSEDDITDRQWIDAFRRRGIDVFTTTDQGDPRTLTRLRRLLSTFEFVTTNGFGTHIALAAYCGAKVSVFGPFADFPRERMAATHALKVEPGLIDVACELCSEAALRRDYPFLFVEPDQAVERRPWGAVEMGEPCRVPPNDLRALFEWEAA